MSVFALAPTTRLGPRFRLRERTRASAGPTELLVRPDTEVVQGRLGSQTSLKACDHVTALLAAGGTQVLSAFIPLTLHEPQAQALELAR